jgi:hypothetical protein
LQPAEHGTRQAALYVGDLWDGRLLAAVHRYRLSKGSKAVLELLPQELKQELQSSGIVEQLERSEDTLGTSVVYVLEDVIVSKDSSRPLDKPTKLNHPLMDEFWKEFAKYPWINTMEHVLKDTMESPLHQMKVKPQWSNEREPPEQVERAKKLFEQQISEEPFWKSARELDPDEVNFLSKGGHVAEVETEEVNPIMDGWHDTDCVCLCGKECDIHGHRFFRYLLESGEAIKPQYDQVPISAKLCKKYGRPAGFRPEPWQLKLFECIDKRESILVVAPTSSGKTMSAEYAVRVVCIEMPSESIVVFVQPTNAMVRQTYSDFLRDPAISKHLAMFTGEQQRNFSYRAAWKFKVLITNHACLGMLLTDPTRGEIHTRLKYAIFDEVHCVSKDLGGKGWEQIISMVNCPIIALSATLANVKQFHSWLEDVTVVGNERSKVKLVEHKQRSTALHFFQLLKCQAERFQQLVSLEGYEETRILGAADSLHCACPVDDKVDAAARIEGTWEIHPKKNFGDQVFDAHFLENKQRVCSVVISLRHHQLESRATALYSDGTHNVQFVNSTQKVSAFHSTKSIPIRWTVDLDSLVTIRLFIGGKKYLDFPIKIEDGRRPDEIVLGNFDLDVYHPAGGGSNESSEKAYNQLTLSNLACNHSNAKWKQVSKQLPLRKMPVNPLALLPNIDVQNRSAVDEFMAAVDALQPTQLVQVYQSLHTRLEELQWRPEWSFAERPRLPTELRNLYHQMKKLHSNTEKTGHFDRAGSGPPDKSKRAHTSLDSEEAEARAVAEFRISYSAKVAEMKNVILKEQDLSKRVWYDAVIARLFHAVGHDWYGGVCLPANTRSHHHHVPPHVKRYLNPLPDDDTLDGRKRKAKAQERENIFWLPLRQQLANVGKEEREGEEEEEASVKGKKGVKGQQGKTKGVNGKENHASFLLVMMLRRAAATLAMYKECRTRSVAAANHALKYVVHLLICMPGNGSIDVQEAILGALRDVSKTDLTSENQLSFEPGEIAAVLRLFLDEEQSKARVKIHEAWYGHWERVQEYVQGRVGSLPSATDGFGADVTTKVQSLVDSGHRSFTADNETFGDTLVGRAKNLFVRYSVAGSPSFSDSVSEGDRFQIRARSKRVGGVKSPTLLFRFSR